MPRSAPLRFLSRGSPGSHQAPVTSVAAAAATAALAVAALFGTSASAAALHRHSDSFEKTALLRREVLPRLKVASSGSGEEALQVGDDKKWQNLWNDERQLKKLDKLLRKVHGEVGNATANWTLEGQRAIEGHLQELKMGKNMKNIRRWAGKQKDKAMEKLAFFVNKTCGDSMTDMDMPEEDEVQDEAFEFFNLINDFRSREHECIGKHRKVKKFSPEAALALDCELSSAAQRLAEVEAKDEANDNVLSVLKRKMSVKSKASGLCYAIAEGVPLREASLMHTEVIRGPFERNGEGSMSAAKAAFAVAVETVGSKVCQRFGNWKFRRAGVGYHRSEDGSQEVFTVIMHQQNECDLPTTCYPSAS